MKKVLALAVLVLFSVNTLAFAATTATKTTAKTTKVVKVVKSKKPATMSKASKMAAPKPAETPKPAKRNFFQKVWHKLFGWMKKKPALAPTSATK